MQAANDGDEHRRASTPARRRITGAEILAFGGIVASAITAAAGLVSPRLVSAAGVTMLVANAAAILVERAHREEKRP